MRETQKLKNDEKIKKKDELAGKHTSFRHTRQGWEWDWNEKGDS